MTESLKKIEESFISQRLHIGTLSAKQISLTQMLIEMEQQLLEKNVVESYQVLWGKR